MREIELTQGYKALVDDEDYDGLMRFKWHVFIRTENLFYACTDSGRTRMHRMIMETYGHDISGKEIDHVDGNSLNNTKINLRICSRRENNQNRRKFKVCSSPYKGVSFDKQYQRWRACIKEPSGKKLSKRFDCETDAAKWYNEKAIELFGNFAVLNKV